MSKPKHVILFNGPPRAGKDVGALTLYNMGGYRLLRFSDPLKAALPAFFNLPAKDLEVTKDEANPDLPYNMTYRQAQISLSEDWAKVQFGQSIFGELLARRIAEEDKDCVIPDSGFLAELIGLVSAAQLADCQFLVIRVERPGKTFARDSRGYLTPGSMHGWANLKFATVENNGSITSYVRAVRKAVHAWKSDL